MKKLKEIIANIVLKTHITPKLIVKILLTILIIPPMLTLFLYICWAVIVTFSGIYHFLTVDIFNT